MILLPKTAAKTVCALVLCFLSVAARAEQAGVPAHGVYTPLISNLKAPAACAAKKADPALSPMQGQEWEPGKWGGGWTAQKAVRKFFEGRIFERQYMRYAQVPVVELGPTFYILSELDQQRTLHLLADQMGVFRQGYRAIELQDWTTHEVIGSYTPAGLTLK